MSDYMTGIIIGVVVTLLPVFAIVMIAMWRAPEMEWDND